MGELAELQVGIDSRGARRGGKEVEDSLDRVKGKARNTIDTMETGFGTRVKNAIFSIQGALAALGIGAFAASSVRAFAQFSASVQELSAITGATGRDLAFLREEALRFGETTTQTASEAAEAFKLVASAKPDLLENAEALSTVTEEVIRLAEASRIDLSSAAVTVGSALNQFGASAEEAGRFVNVLAAGAKFGASEVFDTAEALRQSGTVASAAKVSFEELNGAIQVLGTISIKGAQAGTGLRNVLLKMEADTNRQIRPSVVGLTQALKNLGDQNLDTTELTKKFGLENVVVAQKLISSADAIENMTDKVTGTNTALEQQRVNMDSLQGDLTALGSALEAFQIKLVKNFEEPLRAGTTATTDFIRALGGFPEEGRSFLQFLNDARIGLSEQSGFTYLMNQARESTFQLFNVIGDVSKYIGLSAAIDATNDSYRELVRRTNEAAASLLNLSSDTVAEAASKTRELRRQQEELAGAMEDTARVASMFAIDLFKVKEAMEGAESAWSKAANQSLPTLTDAMLKASRAAVTFRKAQEEGMDELRRKELQQYVDRNREAKRILESLKTDQERFNDQIKRLNELKKEGALTEDQFKLAVERTTEAYQAQTEQARRLNDVADQIGFTFSSAFEDAIVEGKKFGDLVDGLIKDVLRLIVRFTVTEPLARNIAGIVQGGLSGGTGGGGGIFGGIRKVLGLQQGGSFTIPNAPDQDNKLVVFRGQAGEHVTVTPRGQQASLGGRTVVVNVAPIFNIRAFDSRDVVTTLVTHQNVIAGLVRDAVENGLR